MRAARPERILALLFSLLAVCGAGCVDVKVWKLRPERAARAVRDLTDQEPFGQVGLRPHAASGVSAPLAIIPELAAARTWSIKRGGPSSWLAGMPRRLYGRCMAVALEVIAADPDPRAIGEARVPLQHVGRPRPAADGRPRHQARSGVAQEWIRRGLPVVFARGPGLWAPEHFDEFRFAGDYVVSGMDHYYGSNGLGVPLIAVRSPSRQELDRREGAERFFPYWEVYPVTALLAAGPEHGGGGAWVLELHDALTRELRAGRRPRRTSRGGPDHAYGLPHRSGPAPALREDLVPDAREARPPGGPAHAPSLRAGQDPRRDDPRPGVEPQGLGAGPERAPGRRRRYEPGINSGRTCIRRETRSFCRRSVSARRCAKRARSSIPTGQTAAYDQMVLIGHSMGGLLIRLAITDSRDALWRIVSTKPVESLVAGPEDRELITQVFVFRPLPFVKRAVFIATPHRGSELANDLLGRVGRRADPRSRIRSAVARRPGRPERGGILHAAVPGGRTFQHRRSRGQ